MREVYLEGRLMTDRAAAHAEIKDKLSLPEVAIIFIWMLCGIA